MRFADEYFLKAER